MERRLAAILAADVVGYTRLMGQDEAGTVEALKAHRTEFIEPKLAEHRGRLINQKEPAAEAGEPPRLERPCPCCGGPMIVIQTFEPGHAPRAPPAKADRS